MSTPEHHEVARLLLAKAGADLSAARLLAGDAEQDDGVVGFHAQQAVEKALKAVLAGDGLEIPRTHDLAFLVELVTDAMGGRAPEIAAVAWLSPWAVTMRYDLADAPLDRSAALSVAESTVGWAAARLDQAR